MWKIAIIATGVLERVRAESRNRAASSGFDEQEIQHIAAVAHATASGPGW